MDIEIRHCNNIVRAHITLTADKLNIKFAPNGTGKSTLSRAISCAARDDIQGLQALMPFRLRGENPDSTGPIVIGADGIGDVMCFNEEYVSQFTFQPDELISDSFNRRIIRCCISHPVARSKSRPGRSLLIQLRVYKRRVRRNVQGQANSRY